MADYQITIQATCTGLDAIEAQLNRILSKNGPIELTANISGLDKQIRQVQSGMVSSGKTVATNFSKGFNSGLKAVKAPTLREVTNLNKRIKENTEQAFKDIKVIDPNIDDKTAKKSANQYISQKVKAEKQAEKEIQKEREANLKQIKKAEASSTKRRVQQQIAEMKSNAALKNAPHDAWVQTGKDNMSQWRKNYQEQVKAEKQAQAEIQKIRNANLKQIEKAEASSLKRQVQQQIAEMKSNAALKNAPHDAWVQTGKDNIARWRKDQQERAKTIEKLQKEASSGKLESITSGLEKDLRNLGKIAPDRISELEDTFKRADSLRKEIESGKDSDGNNLLDNDLIKKKQQFDDYTNSIKNGIKTLNNEFSGLNKPIDRLDAISASNKTLKWLKDNSKAAKDYGEVLEDLATKQRNATTQGEMQNLNRQVSAIKSQAALEGKTGSSFGDQIVSDVKRLGSAFSAFGVLDNLVYDLPRQLYTAVAQVDNAMTNLKMATGVSNDEALQLMDTYSAMGDRLKATSTDVAASSVEWLKQGKSISEANSLTEDAIVLSKIGDLSAQDATKTITAAMKSYNLSADEVMGFVDQISAIDMASATDVGGLATAFNEVAANAKQAGVSTEELLSYAAVIGETTQEGMASVGTSLNAIFSRMGNIKLSRLKDYETGEDLNTWGVAA